MEFQIENAPERPLRLDRFLADRLPGLSRARVQSLIRDGSITIDDRQTKPKHLLSAGETVRVTIPEPAAEELIPQDIPLDVLFEDEHLIVLNKPHGLVVHPAAGNPDGTLVNALLYHCDTLSTAGEADRPGIVHRLDKDTSGCLVAAKSDTAYHKLVEGFAGREMTKIYLAVVEGRPAHDSGRIENRIGRNPNDRQKMAILPPPAGKSAVTDYEVRNPRQDASLVECRLHTGRTHQIRVHMKSLGTPILGDPIYARPARQKVAASRLMLHAWKLGFPHPVSGEAMQFESEPPAAFDPWL